MIRDKQDFILFFSILFRLRLRSFFFCVKGTFSYAHFSLIGKIGEVYFSVKKPKKLMSIQQNETFALIYLCHLNRLCCLSSF